MKKKRFWDLLIEKGVEFKKSSTDNLTYRVEFSKRTKEKLEDIKEELEFLERIKEGIEEIPISKYFDFLEKKKIIKVDEIDDTSTTEPTKSIIYADTEKVEKIYKRLEIPSLMEIKEKVHNIIAINGDLKNNSNLNIGNGNSINNKFEYAKFLEEFKPFLMQQGISEKNRRFHYK